MMFLTTAFAPRCRRSRVHALAFVAALFVVAVGVCGAAAAQEAPATATRQLLDRLGERQMPDVVLWVLERVAADPDAPADLKQEVPFRRAVALLGTSRMESNPKRRAEVLATAEQELDAFLKASPTGGRAIEAYTQKGNLQIERGRSKVDQAKKPGADAKSLLAEAAAHFDAAIKVLEGKVKPDQPITEVTNAEDAVIAEYRAVRDRIKELKGGGGGDDKPKKPKPRSGSAAKELAELEELEEQLQGKLIQTRLMVASAYFEKAKAYSDGSKEWRDTVDASAKQFKEIADKYPTKGGGLFARYYEARNYTLLGKDDLAKSKAPGYKPDPKNPPTQRLDTAVGTLAPLTVLESKAPLAISLRAKAVGTVLDCYTALGKFDLFDKDQRAFALTNVPPERLDTDWLTLKYRAAEFLEAASGKLPPGEKTKAFADIKKLATDVAKANKDLASEARALLAKIGKDAPEIATEENFESFMEEARLSLASMQEAQAAAKQQPGTPTAEEAAGKATAARDKAFDQLRAALKTATADTDINAVNQARYLLTYLLYERQQYHDAAAMGAFLLDRYPNAKGSRQAAKIAMVSWQQLQQKQADAGWKQNAKEQAAGVADRIMQTWPTEPDAADAALIAMVAATEARDPARIIGLVERVPTESPRRAELLLRGGTALWREVLEDRRLDEGNRRPDDETKAWKAEARKELDEGLKAVQPGTALPVVVSAALARCQIALDDGEPAVGLEVLERPGYGPWTVVNDPKTDPALGQGSFAEAVYTVALRCFIEAEQLEKAEEAMKGLERLAGDGEEASAKLTAMYFTMGRDLQGQLEGQAKAVEAGDASAAQKAAVTLAGFEKFLDRLAARDKKVSSQTWIATTYLSLGSGKDMGKVVPKQKAEQYLDRAAAVYAGLLKKKDDQATPKEERDEIANFEPSIRLRMANIFKERGKWDEALEQIDWILKDPKRQNSLDTQVQAAELLQAAGLKALAENPARAEELLKAAIVGRKNAGSVIWGWNGLANKLARQAFAGTDEKSLRSRTLFFESRLNVALCLLDRAKLPGKPKEEADDLLGKAATAISMTRKLYPDLGGEAMATRYEKVLKDVQKKQGAVNPRGFAELDEQAAAAAATPQEK
ncbi:MAG: hypothetical protein WCC69_12635 [Pirellulales bacterium]